LKISKKGDGNQSNYVSNIVAVDQLLPPVEATQPTRIAHVPKNTAATLTPTKEPTIVAAAQISNVRRKSSISERLIHPSVSGPNLLDNIIQDMNRTTATASAEHVNVNTPNAQAAAANSLKVLTPGQLNSNCTTKEQPNKSNSSQNHQGQSQRTDQNKRMPSQMKPLPSGQPMHQQQQPLQQDRTSSVNHQQNNQSYPNATYETTFLSNNQQNGQMSQQENQALKHYRRTHSQNDLLAGQHLRYQRPEPQLQQQQYQNQQRFQINQPQYQTQLQNQQNYQNWPQNWQINQQQRHEQSQQQQPGASTIQHSSVFSYVGPTNQNAGSQYGLERQNSLANNIPG
jgi:hypothetical protein